MHCSFCGIHYGCASNLCIMVHRVAYNRYYAEDVPINCNLDRFLLGLDRPLNSLEKMALAYVSSLPRISR